LLKLKFRVAKNTFNRETLVSELALTPLNDLPDLPVYGREPRVKCQNLRGPWQEIQLQVNTLAEIDKPAFWKFLARAIEGFQKFSDRARANPENVMPWKVLGQKWHFSRKGFPPGKPATWSVDLLEELCETLQGVAPQGQFLWNNQQVVHVFVPGQSEPWASLFTKRQAGLDLQLTGPKGRFALGRLTGLAADREFHAGPQLDVIKLRFIEAEDLTRGDLAVLLREHIESLGGLRGAALAGGGK
jgi:excinuclease ABC subunit A